MRAHRIDPRRLMILQIPIIPLTLPLHHLPLPIRIILPLQLLLLPRRQTALFPLVVVVLILGGIDVGLRGVACR